jgi:hypothetical protein
VAFVRPTERAARVQALRQVGVGAVISSWEELKGLLDQRRVPPAGHT